MKTKKHILLILLILVFQSAWCQEKDKKQEKAERKAELQALTEELITTMNFDFVANTALPTGYRSVNLASNPNYVRFRPEEIDCMMPYFGTSYTMATYGGDGGIRFKAKPEQLLSKRGKKNYNISATVKGEADTYDLSLSVGPTGMASLTVSCKNRSTITYSGAIKAPEAAEGLK
jgi:hypothetical protein